MLQVPDIYGASKNFESLWFVATYARYQTYTIYSIIRYSMRVYLHALRQAIPHDKQLTG